MKYVNAHNRAPFDRDSARLPKGAASQIMKNVAKAKPLTAASTAGAHTNVKVNQDRNPWPKAEVGSAVDPVTGSSCVVMTNDFRENWDYQFSMRPLMAARTLVTTQWWVASIRLPAAFH